MNSRKLTGRERRYVAHVLSRMCITMDESGEPGQLLLQLHHDAIAYSEIVGMATDALALSLLFECLTGGLDEEAIKALKAIVKSRRRPAPETDRVAADHAFPDLDANRN